MKVGIKKTCDSTGIKEGEIYEACRYALDPSDKVTLLWREPDLKHVDCNEYIHNVEIIREEAP